MSPKHFLASTPKGVVPTLVHDGTVVTESNDILIYLEETFPEPGFRRVASGVQQEIDDWLKLSGDIHIPGIMTFQYIRVNAAPGRPELRWLMSGENLLR